MSIGIGVPFIFNKLGGGGTPPNPDFISTWDTTKAGSASDTIVLPMTAGPTVDWGDGTVNNLNTHTYGVGGIKTVTMSGTIQGWAFNTIGDCLKLIEVSNWGTMDFNVVAAPTTNTAGILAGCQNLIITATDVPIISTTSLKSFFHNCKALSTIDLSNWDISTINSMAGIFYGCTNLVSAGIGSWDVGNVTNFGRSGINFSGGFESCTNFNEDISSWDVSSGTDFTKMFWSSGFNQPIGNWTNMSPVILNQTFRDCGFTGSLANWTVTGVTNFSNFMANGTAMSTANYDATLIAWDAQGAMAYSGTVNFGGSKYTSGGAAEAARTSLITKWGGITDGGAA